MKNERIFAVIQSQSLYSTHIVSAQYLLIGTVLHLLYVCGSTVMFLF
jgi:hypothetical protein